MECKGKCLGCGEEMWLDGWHPHCAIKQIATLTTANEALKVERDRYMAQVGDLLYTHGDMIRLCDEARQQGAEEAGND